MEIAMFSLATIVFFLGNQPTYTVTQMPSEAVCWKLAHEFVHKAPESVATGAVALGAGCVIRQVRPS